MCKEFEIREEDLIGKTDFDVSPTDLAQRYKGDDKEVMKTGKRKWIEEQWGKKKGKRKWIETVKTPIYDDKGKIAGVSGIARDITLRKRSEESLRESEEKYRVLTENLRDVVVRILDFE